MPDSLEHRLERLRNAKADPGLMALIALDFLLEAQPASLQKPLRDAVEAAAVPHWFDASMLAYLLNQPEGDVGVVINRLQAFPMIEFFGERSKGTFNVHETTRVALRRQLLENSPLRFHALSGRILEFLKERTEPQIVVE
jgi:hypothetical protein